MKSPLEIIGHANQREKLGKLVVADRLPNTLIFSGISGIGKQVIALAIASALACQNRTSASACGACRSCELIKKGNYPDLYRFECGQSLKVEEIRQTLYQLHLTAFSGSVRVALFNDAEYLAVQAQQVLLKTLEEPRPDTYFFLITGSLSRLLPTVRSRSQIWHFNDLSPIEIRTVIESDPDQWSGIVGDDYNIGDLTTLANGSLATLRTLIEHLDEFKEVRSNLTEIAAGNRVRALEYADSLAGKRDSLELRLSLIQIAARSEMKSSLTDALRWSVLLRNCVVAESLLFERNLAPLSVLSFLLLRLAEVDQNNIVDLPPGTDFVEKVAV